MSVGENRAKSDPFAVGKHTVDDRPVQNIGNPIGVAAHVGGGIVNNIPEIHPDRKWPLVDQRWRSGADVDGRKNNAAMPASQVQHQRLALYGVSTQSKMGSVLFEGA